MNNSTINKIFMKWFLRVGPIGRGPGISQPTAFVTMPRNESTLRAAPPTRAPSILGCESNSAALSGLTLPPVLDADRLGDLSDYSNLP